LSLSPLFSLRRTWIALYKVSPPDDTTARLNGVAATTTSFFPPLDTVTGHDRAPPFLVESWCEKWVFFHAHNNNKRKKLKQINMMRVVVRVLP
jgi:hypothetical protein